MVFVVIITFGVCWFPQNIRFFLRGLNYPQLSFWEQSTDLLLYVQTSAQVIAYANSCINPILYGAFSERFRNGMWLSYQRFICRKSNLPFNDYPRNSKYYFRNQKTEIETKKNRRKNSNLPHKKSISNSFSNITTNDNLKRFRFDFIFKVFLYILKLNLII